MKKIVFLLVCSVMATGMRGQTKNFIDQPYLETSARVDTLVTPDIIYLHILIREQDEKGRVSVEEMENK
ncbi:MAG: SIMPL domain-containing protein, partial [Flavobacteriaceae bacterium]